MYRESTCEQAEIITGTPLQDQSGWPPLFYTTKKIINIFQVLQCQYGRGYLVRMWSEIRIDITNRFIGSKKIGFNTPHVQENYNYFFQICRCSIINMGVAILSGCDLRDKSTSSIVLLGQNTQVLIPYMTKKTVDNLREIRQLITDMGVAIVSGCGLRVKWTSPIDLLGQKTLGLIPYLLFLCEYEFIHVKFEIFPRSSKGRGHRLHRHITFFPPKFFLIYRPYWSQITSQTFYTQMIVRLFGQILDYIVEVLGKISA